MDRGPLRSYQVSASQEISTLLWDPNVSLPLSQALATCHYSKQEQSNFCLPIPLLEGSILILFSHKRLDFSSSLFPSGLQTKAI